MDRGVQDITDYIFLESKPVKAEVALVLAPDVQDPFKEYTNCMNKGWCQKY